MWRWIRRQREGDNEHPLATKPRTGRPKVLSEIQENQLSEAVRREPFTSSVELKENLQLTCSNNTVRRTLHKKGFKCRVAAQKEQLTPIQATARLRFANEHLQRNWRGVVFTDEKTFRTSDSVKRRVWRQSGTRYARENIQEIHRSGRICLSLWGWMNHEGPGVLVETPSRMTAHDYLNILQNHLLPTYRARYPDGPLLLVHDNAPVHTARMVKEWLREQRDIQVIEWPAKSPDLNPIENLWGAMVRERPNRDEVPRNREDLLRMCNQVWEDMRRTNICVNLVASMQSRLQECIAAGGYYTKY